MQSKKTVTLVIIIACSALLAGGCSGRQPKTVVQPAAIDTAPAEAPKPVPALPPELVTLISPDDLVLSEDTILIDIRAATDAVNGHIPGAVNIPFSVFEEKKNTFPSDHAVPIVLYGINGDTEKAFRALRKWGYGSVSVIEGGVKKWLGSGKQLIRGPLDTEIK